MERLGLSESRHLIIRFIENGGDLTAKGNPIPKLVEEAIDILAKQEAVVRADAADLRSPTGVLPLRMQEALQPSLLLELPESVQNDYREAKEALARGLLQSGSLTIISTVVPARDALYRRLLGHFPEDDKQEYTIERELQDALGVSGKKDAKGRTEPMKVIGPLIDVRKNHRNPAFHAERRYEIEEEAVRVLYWCSEALARIADELSYLNMPRSGGR